MVVVKFTKHAEDMLIERGFSRSVILKAIEKPDWTENKDDDSWYAFQRIGNKVLRVVVRNEDDSYIVITMFYDRRVMKAVK